MQLEKQVVSLELAKRLDELKVKQVSHFWWCQHDHEMYELECGDECSDSIGGHSAFTVAELGNLLPKELKLDKAYDLNISFGYAKWVVAFVDRSDGYAVQYQEVADTEADARAKTLVYLLENKLITIS